MAIRTSDTIVTPDVGTSEGREPARDATAWIASYALGLASARCRTAWCIDGIVDTAASDADRLRDARRHLSSFAVVDEELRARAHALLSIAIASLQVQPGELADG